MDWLRRIQSLVTDPPPAHIFEVSEAGVAMAHLGPGKSPELAFEPLPPGSIAVSPVKDNVLDADSLAAAFRKLAPPPAARKPRPAALLLPDFAVRVSVFEFDSLPKDPAERTTLIKFRMKKTVPFDLEASRLSFWPQKRSDGKLDVISAAIPLEILARYEAPLRACALHPGIVMPSSLAMLRLVEDGGLTMAVRLENHSLTLLVVQDGVLRLLRCLEIGHADPEGILSDLYPTLVYVADTFGAPPARVVLAGFGASSEPMRALLSQETPASVEIAHSPLGKVLGPFDAGLLGYLYGAGVAN
ncbi:MAG: hypothetical protein IPM24_23325 [Bryobacterales bacterium]|nr:hypothetical protein [Bryobacterales bacterium]